MRQNLRKCIVCHVISKRQICLIQFFFFKSLRLPASNSNKWMWKWTNDVVLHSINCHLQRNKKKQLPYHVVTPLYFSKHFQNTRSRLKLITITNYLELHPNNNVNKILLLFFFRFVISSTVFYYITRKHIQFHYDARVRVYATNRQIVLKPDTCCCCRSACRRIIWYFKKSEKNEMTKETSIQWKLPAG